MEMARLGQGKESETIKLQLCFDYSSFQKPLKI